MRTILLTTLAVSLLSLQTYAQDAREISIKSSDAIEFSSMEMATTLYIHDHRGNTRERQVAVATGTFGGVTKTLMRFIAPADVQGTSILIYDYEEKGDDMWVYLPSLRRTRRIVSTERGKSFMGSEFSNADMSRPNIDDFDYKLLGEETFNGKDCWKIEATAKNRDVESEYGFRKRISYIDKSTYLVQQSELLDRFDKPYKVQTLGDYRKQPNGKYFSFAMEMKNVQNKRRSEMKVTKFQLGSNLNEASFAVASLEK
jgi:outer membrane lipoprotein-sorting protein